MAERPEKENLLKIISCGNQRDIEEKRKKRKKNIAVMQKSRIFATSFNEKELFEITIESRCNSVGRVADL